MTYHLCCWYTEWSWKCSWAIDRVFDWGLWKFVKLRAKLSAKHLDEEHCGSGGDWGWSITRNLAFSSLSPWVCVYQNTTLLCRNTTGMTQFLSWSWDSDWKVSEKSSGGSPLHTTFLLSSLSALWWTYVVHWIRDTNSLIVVDLHDMRNFGLVCRLCDIWSKISIKDVASPGALWCSEQITSRSDECIPGRLNLWEYHC